MADVQVRIDTDEYYPVFYICSAAATYGQVVTVDEARLEWWRRAADDWQEAQDDMARACGDD